VAFKDGDIEEVIKQDTRLPVTHRSGFRGSRDDVAVDNDGKPTSVPTPETPDDRFAE
jgi:hypothetical protein